jgi:tetratricopeptide (TPR) repeat protein
LIQCNLGEAYEILGRYQDALVHFQRALSLEEIAGNARDAAVVLVGIARALRRSMRPREAITHSERAVDYARQTGDTLTEAEAREEIGRSYLDLGDDRGVQMLQQALTAYETKGHRGAAELRSLVQRLTTDPTGPAQATPR